MSNLILGYKLLIFSKEPYFDKSPQSFKICDDSFLKIFWWIWNQLNSFYDNDWFLTLSVPATCQSIFYIIKAARGDFKNINILKLSVCSDSRNSDR